MTHTHNRRSIVLVAGFLALLTVCASAGPTIWGGTYPNAQSFQGGFFVDPVTGITSPAPDGIVTYGASSSPYVGWVFVTTPLNLWKVPVAAPGIPQALGSDEMLDLAFDPGTGALYGIVYSQLYTIDYSCPGYTCTATPLGVSIPRLVQGIDFVPGRGIYGADIDGGLWLVNPNTLQVSFIGDTFVSGITDLAYDSFTRRLIAVSVGVKCISFNCSPLTGMIWSIDPLTAQSVLLNDNAPPIYGLAELTPEPGSIALFTTGAIGLFAAVRRRLVR